MPCKRKRCFIADITDAKAVSKTTEKVTQDFYLLTEMSVLQISYYWIKHVHRQWRSVPPQRSVEIVTERPQTL